MKHDLLHIFREADCSYTVLKGRAKFKNGKNYAAKLMGIS